MKKTAKEIIDFIDTLELADDTKISMMEDITDSIVPEVDVTEYTDKIADLSAEVEDLTGRLKDITDRFKARFLEGGEEPTPEPEDEATEEYIDVKEI